MRKAILLAFLMAPICVEQAAISAEPAANISRVTTSFDFRYTEAVLKRVSRLLSSGLTVTGAGLLALLLLLAVAGPSVVPYDPTEQRPAERLQGPSLRHWAGTDRFGRDILTRLAYGGRVSLGASGVALVLVMTIGLAVGMVAGYAGGAIDELAMRTVDAILAFPSIVLGLVVAGLFGPGLWTVLLPLTAVSWASPARLTRGLVLQARESGSVEAARAVGASTTRILRRELLPVVLGPLVILATVQLATLMLSLSALSFLGLGPQPPSPEWGAMLSDGRAHFMVAPHLMVFPGLMIFWSVLALNLLGEGLRDLRDPRALARVR